MRLASRKRLIGVGVVLIAAIVGAAYAIIEIDRAEALASYRTATVNLANGMASQTSAMLGAVDLVLKQLQARLVVKPDRTPAQVKIDLRRKPVFDFIAERQKVLPGVAAIALIDTDGRVANSSRAWPPPAEVADPSLLRHFTSDSTQANSSGGLFVTAPAKNATTGAWSILLARRLDSQRGAFAGVITAEIPLTYVAGFYSTAIPAHGSVAVTRRDGVMLLHYPDHAAETGLKIPENAAWYGIVASGGGAYSTPEYFDGTPSLAVVRPLPALPVVVEASVALGDALATWQHHRIGVIAVSLYASICVFLLLRLLDGQLHRLEASERTLAGTNAKLQIANVHLDVARRHLDVVFSNVSQGLCLFNAGHKLIVCNKRYREIYMLPPGAAEPGVSLQEIINHCYAARGIFTDVRNELLNSFTLTARSGMPRKSLLEMTDGRTIAIHQQPMPDGGWVATHEDITERRQAEAKIAYLARHDVLTGLPNRSLFEERIEQAMAGAVRGAAFAVLFLDLDRFKAINDTLGHQAGDALLRSVAARLLESVRDIDTVARLGGDEFVVLQVGLESPADAADLAQRIIDVIAVPYDLDGQSAEIGVSIGVEFSTQEPVSADTLIKNADLALYIAKSEGRGIFRFFEPEMDARAQNRYALERDLRHALAHDEFEIYYQPIVDLRSRQVCAYEGLLRWNHPVRGLVQPGDFIAAAEDCGLIVAIGAWVLRTVCQRAAAWPTHIHAAVNLSPIQFRAAQLHTVVRDALAASGLPATRLELEITESVLLASDESTISLLHELRGLGISIVMDDFGIGYSSLSYLRRFPFDKIKIDQSFVADLTKRNDALYIVRAITGLCRNMNIRTTVEGVETAEQLDILVEEGCSEAQGYYFGEPKPAHLFGLPRSKEEVLF
jgi:diguanylate cyclase (GGDEF)-like protein